MQIQFSDHTGDASGTIPDTLHLTDDQYPVRKYVFGSKPRGTHPTLSYAEAISLIAPIACSKSSDEL